MPEEGLGYFWVAGLPRGMSRLGYCASVGRRGGLLIAFDWWRSLGNRSRDLRNMYNRAAGGTRELLARRPHSTILISWPQVGHSK